LDELNNHEKNENTLLNFFISLIMLSVGIYLITQNTQVVTLWHTWSIGSFRLPSGLITIPFLISIIMLFFNSKSIWGWMLFVIGLIIILITIIMSVSIIFRSTSLYNYLLMFGLTAAGFGLLLRTLFAKKKINKYEER